LATALRRRRSSSRGRPRQNRRVRTRAGIALLLATVGLTACGTTEEKAARESRLVAKCVQRMMERTDGPRTRLVQDYVRRTYCDPFAKRGWIHTDGTISIRAHEWVLESWSCERVEGMTTTPCDSRALQEAPLLECALLHVVPRNEVRPYLDGLQRRRGKVRCDDGTPLDELGVA
jgi:hypothetical protein